MQAAVKHMKRGGHVITIGSCNADRMPFEDGAVYAMSKAALVGRKKGLARDLGPRGITINNVHPGPIDTDMNPADSDFADMFRTAGHGLAALWHHRRGCGDGRLFCLTRSGFCHRHKPDN